MMEDNEEVDCDDVNFSIHARFGAFDDDTAMEEPEADLQKMSAPTSLGRHSAVRGKIVRVKRRG